MKIVVNEHSIHHLLKIQSLMISLETLDKILNLISKIHY